MLLRVVLVFVFAFLCYVLILFLNIQMESVCENTTTADFKQNNFAISSNGSIRGWSDIGNRQSMEDTHVCITGLAKCFRYPTMD